jgi:NO-binding membrane sensor protein with MHYT domain
VVTVHNFSYGLLNPVLGYVMSCLGAFLGLRCVTRARAYSGFGRARWLSLAAVSIGATGIWTMHFIAMLGYTIPGQQILYNVPITIASMLIAIAVAGIGLFIVGFGNGGRFPLLTGGVIVGIGVATMHYLGMAAMSMPDHMHYNMPLFVLSVMIAIVAGTAALWAGTRVRTVRATISASLIMGVAVSGMHYTGMAAMHLTPGPMPSMGGSTAVSFLLPLLLGVSLLTFVLTLTITLSPTEEEIHADAALQYRIDTQFSPGLRVGGAAAPGAAAPGTAAPHPVAPQSAAPPSAAPPSAASRRPAAPRPATPSAFTPGGYAQDGYAPGGYAQDGYAPGGDSGQTAPSQPLLSRRHSNGRPWGRAPRSGGRGGSAAQS